MDDHKLTPAATPVEVMKQIRNHPLHSAAINTALDALTSDLKNNRTQDAATTANALRALIPHLFTEDEPARVAESTEALLTRAALDAGHLTPPPPVEGRTSHRATKNAPTDTWDIRQNFNDPALGRVDCADARDLNTKVFAAWPQLRATGFFSRRLRADEL